MNNTKKSVDTLCTKCGLINFFCVCAKCTVCEEEQTQCECRKDQDERYDSWDFFDHLYSEDIY